MTDDQKDLRQFVADRDECAFARLAERHWALVWATCKRSGAEEPDDAAQAVFLVLATRAKHLTKRSDLVGFLYETARRVSWQQRRSNQARRQREQTAAVSGVTAMTDPDLNDVIHVALDRLSTADRSAVLLRHAEGLSEAEVGRRLGVTTSAAAMRLSRARAKLRKILGDANFSGLEAGALSIAALAVTSAPLSAISSQAGLLAAGAPSTGPAVALAHNTVKAMVIAKTKVAAVVTAAALAIVCSGTFLAINLTTMASTNITAAEPPSIQTPEDLPPKQADEIKIPEWVLAAATDRGPDIPLHDHLVALTTSGLPNSPSLRIGSYIKPIPTPTPEEIEQHRKDSPVYAALARRSVPSQQQRWANWAANERELVAPGANTDTWWLWTGPRLGAGESATPYALYLDGSTITMVVDIWSADLPNPTNVDHRPLLVGRFAKLEAGKYTFRVLERHFRKVDPGPERQEEQAALQQYLANRNAEGARKTWLIEREKNHYTSAIQGDEKKASTLAPILGTYSLGHLSWGETPFVVSVNAKAETTSTSMRTLSTATPATGTAPLRKGRIPVQFQALENHNLATTTKPEFGIGLTGNRDFPRWLTNPNIQPTVIDPDKGDAYDDTKTTILLWASKGITYSIRDFFYTDPDKLTIRIDAWQKAADTSKNRFVAFEILSPIPTSRPLEITTQMNLRSWSESEGQFESEKIIPLHCTITDGWNKEARPSRANGKHFEEYLTKLLNADDTKLLDADDSRPSDNNGANDF